MFCDLRLRAAPIIVVATILGSLVWFVVLFVRGVAATALVEACLHLSIVIAVLTFAWTIFVKYGWRWKLLRLGGWLVRTPDLNGRWEGTYRSSFDNKERPYVLEIRQNLVGLQCTVWGDENEAEIYSAHLLADREEKQFKLSYLYQARRRAPSRVPGDHHDGWALLRIIDGSPRKLQGEYVNNRDPDPRKAEINAAWVSRKLKGQP
jgi:SMODS-associating 2TM, beta-strand rich effector domain